ncbi:MAG: hypothetical protein V3W41_11285 [Planctomycetota bacterium]
MKLKAVLFATPDARIDAGNGMGAEGSPAMFVKLTEFEDPPDGLYETAS